MTALTAVALTGRTSLWTVVPFIVLMMSSLGLVGPAGSARYMGFFTQLAGSASSVYTTMMFSFGGLLDVFMVHNSREDALKQLGGPVRPTP